MKEQPQRERVTASQLFDRPDPEYVEFLEDHLEYVRGEKLLRKKGDIEKIKKICRNGVILEGSLRWQRVSANKLKASCKTEYDLFKTINPNHE